MPEQEAPEFPKPMVRVRRNAQGFLYADIREVADGEEETAATAEGFLAVPVPPSPFPKWPKWVYHQDGRRQIVRTEADLEKLKGAGDGDWEDAPVEPEPTLLGSLLPR